MILNELKTLIEAGDVGRVVLNRQRETESVAWEIWAYDWPDSGKRTVKSFENVLITGRDKKHKTYTSLDRAWSALREIGYTGPIEIDG